MKKSPQLKTRQSGKSYFRFVTEDEYYDRTDLLAGGVCKEWKYWTGRRVPKKYFMDCLQLYTGQGDHFKFNCKTPIDGLIKEFETRIYSYEIVFVDGE